MTVGSLIRQGKWREAMSAARIPARTQQQFINELNDWLARYNETFSYDRLALTVEGDGMFSFSTETRAMIVNMGVTTDGDYHMSWMSFARRRDVCSRAEHNHAPGEDPPEDDDGDSYCEACDEDDYCRNHDRWGDEVCAITVMSQLGASNIL